MKNNVFYIAKGVSRRQFLQSSVALGVMGCVKKANFCDEPAIVDDGDFKTVEECIPTARNIEGPFYMTNAPVRNNLRIFGDEGIPVSFNGRVVQGDCSEALTGAVIEFWHADPSGGYDNDSEEMRYRCAMEVSDDGYYELETLLPGRYLNGAQYRPHHIHVKVWDAEGNERLTTQLYFEGDEYLECDPFANRSLVMAFEGTLNSEIRAKNIDFIV